MGIRFVIALFGMLLSGCEDGVIYQAHHAAWETAPKDYVCTADQMKLVESETKFCDENTSYFSSYCYGTAFIRNCTKRDAAQGGKSDG